MTPQHPLRRRLASLAYSLLWRLAVPLILFRLLWRGRKQPEYRQHWAERFGFYNVQPSAPLIWLHAVSVGETRAAEPLITALLAAYPDHQLLLTCMTPTGRATGAERFGPETTLAGRVLQAYLPYELPGAVRRFLRHFQPRLGLLMETELWPNLIQASHAAQIPILLVNARLSARSARGYERLDALIRPTCERLSAVAAQTPADAERLAALGCKTPVVCGNLKFDVRPDPDKISQGHTWRTNLGDRPVWLAASTREGEEADLLAAHRIILQTRPETLLILVPRHPQRFAEIATQITADGFQMQRRSQGLPQAETQVWLGDSMGEMPAYYAAADIAAIGGSWQALGGQNLIEAAACACPVIVGPHTFNFAQATADSINAGAAIRLDGTQAIPNTLLNFWAEKQKPQMQAAALAFSAAHQGATERIKQIVELSLSATSHSH